MRGELTAHQADNALGGLMMTLSSAVVGGVMAHGNAMAARREERQVFAYADALAEATGHARMLERVALSAMKTIADLENEVASLRAACRQRQEHIDLLKARAHAA